MRLWMWLLRGRTGTAPRNEVRLKEWVDRYNAPVILAVVQVFGENLRTSKRAQRYYT